MRILVPALSAAAGLVGGYVYWRVSWFLRDPARTVPSGERNIVCAADGVVTYVKRVEAGVVPIAIKGRKAIPLAEYAGAVTDTSGYLIGTYMTEYSVHRNRAPIDGAIVLREHRSAAPFNRSMARMTANVVFDRQPYDNECEYLLTNERLTIGIEHRSGVTVFVTQIADLWVNRIVARVALGDKVGRGDQYGLIRFGSQCDVFLPDALVDRIEVTVGQYVYAGETVLAVAAEEQSS